MDNQNFNQINNPDIDIMRYQLQQEINYETDYSKFKKQFLQNLITTIGITLIFTILVAASGSTNCGNDARGLLILAIMVKCLYVLPLEILYWYSVKYRCMRPTTVQLSRILVLLSLNIWFFYATLAFADSKDECRDKSTAIYVGLVIIMIEAVFTFTATAMILLL